MSIDLFYQEILQKLQLGERPMFTLSPNHLNHIEEEWANLLKIQEWKENEYSLIEKLLCLATHSRFTHENLGQYCLLTIKGLLSDKNSSPRLIILAIAALHQQVFFHSERSGNPLPLEVFPTLEKLLEHKDPEVIAWALRSVEQLGGKSIILRPALKKIKISRWPSFNPHKKAIQEILTSLEKSWNIP